MVPARAGVVGVASGVASLSRDRRVNVSASVVPVLCVFYGARLPRTRGPVEEKVPRLVGEEHLAEQVNGVVLALNGEMLHPLKAG